MSDTKTAFIVSVPLGRDVWVTSNSREHWSRKAHKVRQIRTLAAYVARVARRQGHLPSCQPYWTTEHPCDVTVAVCYPPSVGLAQADPANAEPAVKAIMDGLTDAGVWSDDNALVVRSVTYMRGPNVRLDPRIKRNTWHQIRLEIRDHEEEADR